jgi:hypothetical protein
VLALAACLPEARKWCARNEPAPATKSAAGSAARRTGRRRKEKKSEKKAKISFFFHHFFRFSTRSTRACGAPGRCGAAVATGHDATRERKTQAPHTQRCYFRVFERKKEKKLFFVRFFFFFFFFFWVLGFSKTFFCEQGL